MQDVKQVANGRKRGQGMTREDCRNCEKWNDCPCGKDGHKKGTAQGYSIGECKKFKLRAESEERNDNRTFAD